MNLTKPLTFHILILIVLLLSCEIRDKEPLKYSIRAKNKKVLKASKLADSFLRIGDFKSADSIYDVLANEFADSSDIYFIRLRQIDTKLYTHKWNEAEELVDFCFIQNKVPELPERSLIYYHQYMATIDRKRGDLCASMKQLDSLVNYSKSNMQTLDTGMILLNYQFIIDDNHIDSSLISNQSISSMANLVRYKINCQ